MNPIFYLIYSVLSLYNMVVIATVIVDLLVYFNIINAYQPVVQKIRMVLFKLTEPVLGRIRKYMPNLGGLDISPIVLLIAIQFIQYTIMYYSRPNAF
jgi:YggT family protein